MKIIGIEGLTTDQIHRAVLDGARFVIFQYCFSVIVMTSKKGSDIHFVRATDSAFAKGLPYTLLSLLVGHSLGAYLYGSKRMDEFYGWTRCDARSTRDGRWKGPAVRKALTADQRW